MRKTIDLDFLRDNQACYTGIKFFERHLEETREKNIENLVNFALDNHENYNEPLLVYANWLLCSIKTKKQCIKSALFNAKKALEHFKKVYPDDQVLEISIETCKDIIKRDVKHKRKKAGLHVVACRYALNKAKDLDLSQAFNARQAAQTFYHLNKTAQLTDVFLCQDHAERASIAIMAIKHSYLTESILFSMELLGLKRTGEN